MQPIDDGSDTVQPVKKLKISVILKIYKYYMKFQVQMNAYLNISLPKKNKKIMPALLTF